MTRSKHRSCNDSGFVSPRGALVPRFGLRRRVPHGRSVSCHHKKVTEKIDKLTVFGGLEGVLKDVVRIQVPSA